MKVCTPVAIAITNLQFANELVLFLSRCSFVTKMKIHEILALARVSICHFDPRNLSVEWLFIKVIDGFGEQIPASVISEPQLAISYFTVESWWSLHEEHEFNLQGQIKAWFLTMNNCSGCAGLLMYFCNCHWHIIDLKR